jgi:hypothetical protein
MPAMRTADRKRSRLKRLHRRVKNGQPADERIRRFLKRKEDQGVTKEVSEEAARRDQEHQAKTRRVAGKWVQDTHVIASILNELEGKLAPAELHLGFQDTGAKEDAVATGIIAGRFAGANVEFELRVQPDGQVQISKTPIQGELVQVTLRQPAEISILTANRGEYEALILDMLGVD